MVFPRPICLNTPYAAKKSGWCWNDATGFTLVETLVAATILFTCIAAAALSYNTAIKLNNRLNTSIASGIALADIQAEIKSHLFDGENTGEGLIADGTKYFWQAVRQRTSPTILRQNDDFTGGPVYGNFQIELITVTLTITRKADDRINEFPFEYKELVWKPLKQG